MVILTPLVEQPPSSSSIVYQHDVFLSFRGTDTRHNFMSHLRGALSRASLKTFFDDETIKTGSMLKPELEEGIRKSRASIIVLSKNYASSPWCLEELELILEQSKHKQIVIPIFYHVDPSHVKNQKGTFGAAMAVYTKKMEEETDANKRRHLAQKIKQWTKALTDVGYLKGETYADGRDEKAFVDKIVEDIAHRLQIPLTSALPQLIGMDRSINFITTWLYDDSSHTTDILTIFGMGGIGKTSLAEFVYVSHFLDYDTSSYIENISRRCARGHNGLHLLQKELYSKIKKESPVELPIGSLYTSHIEEAAYAEKVFLVLDDVDKIEQLDALLGRKGFHPGSKIIITTKDASLTERCALFKAKIRPKHTIHTLTGLHETKSRELLCLHALMSNEPKEGYEEVLENLVKYCQGNPLALTILGRLIYNRDVDYWEGCMEQLKRNADSDINIVLRMSFDTLSSNDQELLKHIACFFVGMDKDVAQTILNACYKETRCGFTNLIDRCLISIGGYNQLKMHQLLQDMVTLEVDKESPNKPGERSRLWRHEESYKVLNLKKGTENVLGLTLDIKELKDENLYETFKLETDALSKMENLMLLQLNFMQINSESFVKFPEELRWLCMHGFPLKSLPLNFLMRNLVALDMSYSNIESFGVCCSNPRRPQNRQNLLTGSCSKENSLLGSLKILNLSFCGQLHSIGGFENLPALEKLILNNCIGLLEVCESIEKCVKLVLIDLCYCGKLQNVPKPVGVKTILLAGCNLGKARMEASDVDSSKMLEVSNIHTNNKNTSSAFMDAIPSYSKFFMISLPRSLVILSLANNNLSAECFPADLSCLSMLKELHLDENPIEYVPNGLRTLPSLGLLSLMQCRRLTPPQIERDWSIYLHDNVTALNETVLEVSPHVRSFYSHAIRLFSYEIERTFEMKAMGCIEEKVLRSLGWTKVDFYNKRGMGTGFLHREIQMYYEFGIFSTIFLGIEMPSWITGKSKGPSISFTIPLSPNNLTGLNVFSVLMFPSLVHGFYMPDIIISNITKNCTWTYKHYIERVRIGIVPGLILLSHWMFGMNEMEAGDVVTITTKSDPLDKVFTEECGVSFMYDDGMTDEEDALAYYKSFDYIIGGDLSPFQTTTAEYFLNTRRFMKDAMELGQYHSELVGDGVIYRERVWFEREPEDYYAYLLREVASYKLAAGLLKELALHADLVLVYSFIRRQGGREPVILPQALKKTFSADGFDIPNSKRKKRLLETAEDDSLTRPAAFRRREFELQTSSGGSVDGCG